ncbi:MAG: hypothetical protein ACK4MM_03675 [Fervidobacterium sp.]
MNIETIVTIVVGALLSVFSYSLKRNIENQDKIIDELRLKMESIEENNSRKFEHITYVIHSIEKSLIHFEELEKQFESLNVTVTEILRELKESRNSYIELLRKIDKIEFGCQKNHTRLT